MMKAKGIDTAIIIPARNEAARIAACLKALAPQCGQAVTVILVVNNSSDDTASRARSEARRLRLNLDVVCCNFDPSLGVGEARRRGALRALDLPGLRHLLTTDADCMVAPDWIARNLAHLAQVDAVCGQVELIPEEAVWLSDIDPALQVAEDGYRALVLELYARHATNGADLRGSHGQTPGASLGFTRAGYLAAGGFAPIPCGEDRLIIRTLRKMGRTVRHASDVRVAASCRLTGRAAGGMADTLRRRLSGQPYRADDCLPCADSLIEQVRTRTLGVWPPQVAADDCIPVAELAAQSARLRAFLTATRIEPNRPFAAGAAAHVPACPLSLNAPAAFRDDR